MEELQYYSSLRDKYSQEFNQSINSGPSLSRPQTAPKQVNFDFTNQMDLREFRNLREMHFLELERIGTPLIEHAEKPPKSKKSKKKKKKRRKELVEEVYEFEVFDKPAIDLDLVIALDLDQSIEKKYEKEVLSSRHSVYSEPSVISKKSLKEDIEDAFLEAKKALEESFRQRSECSERKYTDQSMHSAKHEKNLSNVSHKLSNKPESNISIHSNKLNLSGSLNKPDTSQNVSSNKFSSKSKEKNHSFPEVEISIHSEIEEEEKMYQESPKSSVDFTLSDQTPFESLKFSQDSNVKVGFLQHFEDIKKGIYNRLLSPIIQNLAQEAGSDKQSEELSQKDLEKSIEPSPVQLVNEKLEASMRTSKSEPFRVFRPNDSIYSHCSALSITNLFNPQLEDLENANISLMDPPELPQNTIEIQLEKAVLVYKVLEDAEVALMATNVCISFFRIKSKAEKQKKKIQNQKLADANFEFNLLKKTIYGWEKELKKRAILNSPQMKSYLERWKFVRLYQTFQGLKYVCKAHKQWIEEVKKRLEGNRSANIIKNWALFVRYRNVKQYLGFKKAKSMIKMWRKVVDGKKQANKSACIHWYYNSIGKCFDAVQANRVKHFEKREKSRKARIFYYDKLYMKIFLAWKHCKELHKASFIPLRICTKTILVKKNGNLQEKSLFDIRLINHK